MSAEYIKREDLTAAFAAFMECNGRDKYSIVPCRDIMCFLEDAPATNEAVDKREFCDMVREKMTAMVNPMSEQPNTTPKEDMIGCWVKLWWWLDHYCEREPPKWTGRQTDGKRFVVAVPDTDAAMPLRRG